MVKVCLVLQETPILPSRVPLHIPIGNEGEFLFYLRTSCRCPQCLDLGYANRCVVVSHCWINLFNNISWWRILICHLYMFFDESSVKVFGQFFNWVVYFLWLDFKSSLCILCNNPLADESFENIFSRSVIDLF